MEIKENWLALTQEEPIDAELPICDPHHHFWQKPDGDYLLEELFQDIGGGHNIVQTVFVECESINRENVQGMMAVDETSFVDDLTSPDKTKPFGAIKVAAGIVGHVDFTQGSRVVPVIEAHMEASDRFRGIRQVATWDADKEIFSPGVPHLLARADFQEGVAQLRYFGLNFETFVYHPQLGELADLAGKFPDLPIILDHLGGPLRIGRYAKNDEAVFREWKKGIRGLAEHENVFIKLGGLGMPITGFHWSDQPVPPDSAELSRTMAPYFSWCIEHFGADRCMFESNFPVEKMSMSYTVLWNAFKRIAKDFSDLERRHLFHDTAAGIYHLQQTGFQS